MLILEINNPKFDLKKLYDHAISLSKCSSCSKRNKCDKNCLFTKIQIEDIIRYSLRASADMKLNYGSDKEDINISQFADLMIRAKLFRVSGEGGYPLEIHYQKARHAKSTCTCELCSAMFK